jgi:predicted nucleic acid-binding Zn ribbon protein
MPFCRKCGTELKEDAKFCPECGTPIPTLTIERERAPASRNLVNAILILGAIAIIIIAIWGIPRFIMPFLNRPKPDIVLLDGHDGFQGLNYVAFVDVGVRNNGGEGWVTVYAELEGSGYYEELNQRVHLASGETKNLQFVFDISFWHQGFNALTYRARVVLS